jgi:chromosome segregation ATPase
MHLVALVALALGAADATNPVTKVVELISGLKLKIQQDGKAEQALYDKYACWCEKTTDTKKAAIADAKATIDELTKNILKLKGATGSSGADISFLKKNIAENKASTTSATEMRNKEHKEFVETKAALELGMANLKKAIDVLGASSKKTATVRGFKDADTLESGLLAVESESGPMAGATSAKLLSVAAEVRSALKLYTRNGQRLTMQDTDAMKSFLGSPMAMMQSPHKGAYETQSGMIQGILADMMDSFTRDFASNDEEEKTKQTEFDALIKTKTSDLKQLEKALTDKTMNEGDDVKQLATDQKDREETEEELKATEEFLETTIEACKSKADEWAERSRLRTEELAGMNEAIDILTSDSAKGTFATAVDTFVQLGEEKTRLRKSHSAVKRTLTTVRTETVPQKVTQLQTNAAAAQGMKEFEKVQHDIEVMEDDLRDEGMEDIKTKAHCDNERREVNNHQESLEFDMDALQKEMDSGEAKKKLLAKQIQHTTSNMQKLKKEMEEYLNTRNAQNEAFKTALKADSDAVMLLAKTIETLSKYAKNNLSLAQRKKEDPEYTTSEDTAPEATFSSASSGGSETGGIVGIIENIKQDLEEEMAKAKDEEAKSLQAYKDTLKESQDSMAAMEKKIASMEVEIAETTKLVAEKQQTWDDKKKNHDNNEAYLEEIATECDWMDANFDPRKEARDSEIAGLDDAKGALAGEHQAALIVTATRRVGKKPSVDDELQELDETEKSLSFLQRSK